MTDQQLYTLIDAFASFYWFVPVSFVKERIIKRHPEVSSERLDQILLPDNNRLRQTCHCTVKTEGFEEPELVHDELLYSESILTDFINARPELPYFEADDETLLHFDKDFYDLPEAKAIIEFGQKQMKLERLPAEQLVLDCHCSQPSCLIRGESWVMDVLEVEAVCLIQFETLEQVERYRELGNRFYQVRPNPVLKGWRPKDLDLDQQPVLKDDIPASDEEIPSRPQEGGSMTNEGSLAYMREFLSGKAQTAKIQPVVRQGKKIGRNDPCPCGSGKKYKKCCGR